MRKADDMTGTSQRQPAAPQHMDAHPHSRLLSHWYLATCQLSAMINCSLLAEHIFSLICKDDTHCKQGQQHFVAFINQPSIRQHVTAPSCLLSRHAKGNNDTYPIPCCSSIPRCREHVF